MNAILKLRQLPPDLLRRRLRLAETHVELLQDAPGPAVLLDRLSGLDLLWAAVRLLSYALPEREAVWWACRCVAHTAPAVMAILEQKALAAAEAWVRRPDGETRRNAALAAAGAGYDGAAAWAARAAYASRPELPLHMRGGKRVEMAILRAAEQDDAARAASRLPRFIESGRDIAGGGGGRLHAEPRS